MGQIPPAYGKYRFKLVRAKVNHGLRDVRMVNIAKVRGQCFPDRSNAEYQADHPLSDSASRIDTPRMPYKCGVCQCAEGLNAAGIMPL